MASRMCGHGRTPPVIISHMEVKDQDVNNLTRTIACPWTSERESCIAFDAKYSDELLQL